MKTNTAEEYERIRMNVLVVEDEWIYRPAIVQQIMDIEPDAIISEARSLKETFQRLEQTPQTKLIILDLTLDDSAGVDTLKSTRDWCISKEISPRIVVLSANDDVALAREVLKNHATGFILKEGPLAEFKLGIAATLSGLVHVPKHLLDALLGPKDGDDNEDDNDDSKRRPDGELPDSFTDREREACRVLAAGALTYKDMAKKMARTKTGSLVSQNTVRIYVRDAANKLGITDNVKAGLIAALARMRIRGSDR